MNQRTEECRHKAAHCERAASLATTLGVRLIYADLAEHWRKLAEQIEWLDRAAKTPLADEGI
jgi:hypothetical protein